MRKKTLMIISCCFLTGAVYSQNYVHERGNSRIKVKPVIEIKAYAFNLRDVKLLDGSPFKNAMDKDAAYLGDDKGRAFDISIDVTRIGTQELKGTEAGKFFDVEYRIPAELLKGKTKVEVKIRAHPDRTAGRVFSPRILRKI